MKIQGEYTFEAPREAVWEALLDADVLARTVPGGEELKQTAENEFSGKLNIKVGPVQGRFEGKVTLSELDPPSGYRMSIEGKGAPGFVNGNGQIRLEERDGGTAMQYEVDAQVGGRIAGVGQRLLDSSAKVLTRQALEELGEQVKARQGAGGASPSEGAGGAGRKPPSQARFAARFAGGLLGELIPRERRPVVAAAAIGIALVLFLVLLRACS